jgi:hypothetical protein
MRIKQMQLTKRKPTLGRPRERSRMLGVRAIAAAVALGFAGAASPDIDEFAKYPGEPPLSGPPAATQMHLRKARMYRTVLRQAAADGADFNGHYRTVTWGCGTNCLEWAVIDLSSGVVRFAKEPALSCWAPDEPRGLPWPDWIEVRKSSRLLYLHECTPGFRRGPRVFNIRHVYEWKAGRPVLLRTESFTVEDRASQ